MLNLQSIWTEDMNIEFHMRNPQVGDYWYDCSTPLCLVIKVTKKRIIYCSYYSSVGSFLMDAPLTSTTKKRWRKLLGNWCPRVIHDSGKQREKHREILEHYKQLLKGHYEISKHSDLSQD